MKKARTRFFAMTLAILIFSLYALSSSAQTVPESASQFLRAKAAVQLTASEEAQVKEAVLNGEINESNQEDVLKLAMAQYLDRTGTMQTAPSSHTDNDEWIILQEVETAKPMSLNSVPSNQPREKQFVATAFLVLDEDGEKVTPSDAVANGVVGEEVTIGPYDSYFSLPEYFIGGKLTSYITGRLDAFGGVDQVRVDRIITTATYTRPGVAVVSYFRHGLNVRHAGEDFYLRSTIVNKPVSGRGYTFTTGMGFYEYAYTWDIQALAYFFTTTGLSEEETKIDVDIYQLMMEHSSDYGPIN